LVFVFVAVFSETLSLEVMHFEESWWHSLLVGEVFARIGEGEFLFERGTFHCDWVGNEGAELETLESRRNIFYEYLGEYILRRGSENPN
jgi:hypothetical protein